MLFAFWDELNSKILVLGSMPYKIELKNRKSMYKKLKSSLLILLQLI